MICERCGSYMPDDAITCDHCGSLLREGGRGAETGVRAIRQGRKSAAPTAIPDVSRPNIPEYGDYDMSPLPVETEHAVRRKAPTLDSFASRPNTRRGVPVHTSMNTKPIAVGHKKVHAVKRRAVNWMLIGIIAVAVLGLAGAGYYFYMQSTDEGQRTIARRNTLSTNDAMLELAQNMDMAVAEQRETVLKDLNKASAQAYWLVGQEYLDVGDMADAIMALRIADVLDPENYDGLLSLASAYELDNNDAEAEKVYLNLANVISPSRTEAYTALIRMYQDNGRRPEAGEMMKLAYENTDKESFRLQRKDYIPNTPEVDLTAGRYELEQTVHVTSPQGYDVYYTLDKDAALPKGGTLLKNGAVTIPEGTLTLRAVCVSDDLVSDEMSVSYTVYYPSPSAPKCNLAPNTYTHLKTVSLRPGEGDEKTELTYYYTIDGSTPDAEGGSPLYTGEPIVLPSGRVTLRAIAVNGYGKQSSTLEVGYKFDCKPYLQEMYQEKDVFSGFVINSTTRPEFEQRFGAPKSEANVQYLALDNQAKQLNYGWGYAVFTLNSNKWILVRVEMNSELCAGPRGVGFGSAEKEITAAFKDMDQPESPNGNRGLYYADPNIGRVTVQENGEKLVQYSCDTLESKVWVLQYTLKNNRVVKIAHYYQP